MSSKKPGQSQSRSSSHSGHPLALIVPNPRLKLMDQVRQVMRLKHYSLRTERSYSDWIRRFVKFHQMTKAGGSDGRRAGKDRVVLERSGSERERGCFDSKPGVHPVR